MVSLGTHQLGASAQATQRTRHSLVDTITISRAHTAAEDPMGPLQLCHDYC